MKSRLTRHLYLGLSIWSVPVIIPSRPRLANEEIWNLRNQGKRIICLCLSNRLWCNDLWHTSNHLKHIKPKLEKNNAEGHWYENHAFFSLCMNIQCFHFIYPGFPQIKTNKIPWLFPDIETCFSRTISLMRILWLKRKFVTSIASESRMKSLFFLPGWRYLR